MTFGPEVHADGEIWGQTLWELRQRLVAQEGSEAAGSDLAEQLITDGMRLSPPEPSFLDMRNAILQADVGASGGANRELLWSVFATRGMGYFAGALDANDIDPQQDFATPPGPGAPTGTIAGKLTDADSGLPVAGQKVGVGGHATDPSFVDALVTTSGADGTYTLTRAGGRLSQCHDHGRRIQPRAGRGRHRAGRWDRAARRDHQARLGRARQRGVADDQRRQLRGLRLWQRQARRSVVGHRLVGVSGRCGSRPSSSRRTRIRGSRRA